MVIICLIQLSEYKINSLYIMQYQIQMKKQRQFGLSEPQPKYQLSTAIQQFTDSQNQINIRTKITSCFGKMFDRDSDAYQKYSDYLNYPTDQDPNYQNIITPQEIDICLPPEQPIQQTYKLKDKQNFIYTARQTPLISPIFGPISLIKRNSISPRQSWENYKQLLQQMDKYQKEQQRKIIEFQSTQYKLGLIRIQKEIQAKKKQKKCQISFQQTIKPIQEISIQPKIILQQSIFCEQNGTKTNQNVVEGTQNKQSQKIPCLEVEVSQINKFITESFEKNMIDKVLTDKKSKSKRKQTRQQEKIMKIENFSPDKQILHDIKQDNKRIRKNQRKSKNKNSKQQEKQLSQNQEVEKIIKIEHDQHKILQKTFIKSINSHLNLIDLDHDYENPFSSQCNLRQSNHDLRYPRRFHVKPLQYWKNQKTAYCKGKIIGIIKMKSIVQYLRVLKSNLQVISQLVNMKDMIKGLIKFQPLQQISFQGVDQQFQRLIISRKVKEKTKKIIFDNKTVKINIKEDINVLPYEQFSLINKSISVLVLVFTLIYKKVQ